MSKLETLQSQTLSEYCQSKALLVPQGLYGIKDVSVLMQHKEAAIFKKQLESDLIDIEFYTSSPCLVYIHKGEEEISTHDGASYRITAGSAVLLPKGQNYYSDYVKRSEGLSAYLIIFSENSIQQFLSAITQLPKASDSLSVINLDSCFIFENYFSSLNAIKAAGINTAGLLEAKLSEALQLFAQHSSAATVASTLLWNGSENPKRNLSRLMEKKEILRLSVADLATLSGRSASSFVRDFKKVFSTTPAQWLKISRMRYAKELLDTRNYSVSEAALATGYDSTSHFIKVFKSVHGATPKRSVLE